MKLNKAQLIALYAVNDLNNHLLEIRQNPDITDEDIFHATQAWAKTQITDKTEKQIIKDAQAWKKGLDDA